MLKIAFAFIVLFSLTACVSNPRTDNFNWGALSKEIKNDYKN